MKTTAGFYLLRNTTAHYPVLANQFPSDSMWLQTEHNCFIYINAFLTLKCSLCSPCLQRIEFSETDLLCFMKCHTHTLYTIPCLLRSHAVTGVDFLNDECKSQHAFIHNVLQTLEHLLLVLRKPLQSGSGWHATRSCHYLPAVVVVSAASNSNIPSSKTVLLHMKMIFLHTLCAKKFLKTRPWFYHTFTNFSL